MKIRKSKYHQKSVKVVHCGALIWRKFSTNCDAHLAERFLKGRENNHLLKSLFKLSVIFMAFTASGCTLAVPEAGTDGNGDRTFGNEADQQLKSLLSKAGKLQEKLTRDGIHAEVLREEPFTTARDSLDFQVFLAHLVYPSHLGFQVYLDHLVYPNHHAPGNIFIQ